MKLIEAVTADPNKPDVQLRVREDGEEKTLTCWKGAHVSVNGLDARWDALLPGDVLTIRPGHVLADRCQREE